MGINWITAFSAKVFYLLLLGQNVIAVVAVVVVVVTASFMYPTRLHLDLSPSLSSPPTSPPPPPAIVLFQHPRTELCMCLLHALPSVLQIANF